MGGDREGFGMGTRWPGTLLPEWHFFYGREIQALFVILLSGSSLVLGSFFVVGLTFSASDQIRRNVSRGGMGFKVEMRAKKFIWYSDWICTIRRCRMYFTKYMYIDVFTILLLSNEYEGRVFTIYLWKSLFLPLFLRRKCRERSGLIMIQHMRARTCTAH